MSSDEESGGLRRAGRSAVNAVLERVGRGVSKVQENRPLAYDLLEGDTAYLVVFDAPGATKSDVQVRFRDNAVEVRVDRFRDFYEGFEMRFPGRGLALDGRADLPAEASVDATEATATLTSHGTLHVEIPKTEQGRDLAVEDTEDDVAVEGSDDSVDQGSEEE